MDERMILFTSGRRGWPRRPWAVVAAACFALALAAAAGGQDEPPPGEAKVQQVDFGMVLKAEGGAFKNLIGTVTVPGDWPGQQRVRVVKQNLPPGATVDYKLIAGVGRQMVLKIASAPIDREIRAVVTFEVERLTPPPLPEDLSRFHAPDAKSMDRKLAIHLLPSPKIESDNPKVRKAAAAAVGDRKGAWEKVQAVHEWIHKNVAFAGDMENTQTCMTTLEVCRGVCAEMNSLAVAMLRAEGFPARLVRIPAHCYYEVYLVDGEGKGHWLGGDASKDESISPNEAAQGLILQKGDNVSVIDPNSKRRVKGRFLGESVFGTPHSRGASLHLELISPAAKVNARTPVSHPGAASEE